MYIKGTLYIISLFLKLYLGAIVSIWYMVVGIVFSIFFHWYYTNMGLESI